MSEKQAKRLRQMEARVEDQGVRLTACEAALNWTRSYELELKGIALEHTRQDLKRARRQKRALEESLWTWKAVAIAAIVTSCIVILVSIL